MSRMYNGELVKLNNCLGGHRRLCRKKSIKAKTVTSMSSLREEVFFGGGIEVSLHAESVRQKIDLWLL